MRLWFVGSIPFFRLQLPVEGGIGGVAVRVQGDVPKIQSQYSQNDPTNEAEIQNEQLSLMSIHQIFRKVNGLRGGEVGMLCQNKGGHGVAVTFDDTGIMNSKLHNAI